MINIILYSTYKTNNKNVNEELINVIRVLKNSRLYCLLEARVKAYLPKLFSYLHWKNKVKKSLALGYPNLGYLTKTNDCK